MDRNAKRPKYERTAIRVPRGGVAEVRDLCVICARTVSAQDSESFSWGVEVPAGRTVGPQYRQGLAGVGFVLGIFLAIPVAIATQRMWGAKAGQEVWLRQMPSGRWIAPLWLLLFGLFGLGAAALGYLLGSRLEESARGGPLGLPVDLGRVTFCVCRGCLTGERKARFSKPIRAGTGRVSWGYIVMALASLAFGVVCLLAEINTGGSIGTGGIYLAGGIVFALACLAMARYNLILPHVGVGNPGARGFDLVLARPECKAHTTVSGIPPRPEETARREPQSHSGPTDARGLTWRCPCGEVNLRMAAICRSCSRPRPSLTGDERTA
jgi:hypothetical protein